VFMLIRKGMSDQHKVLIDCVTGIKFGGISAANWFPVASPEVNNRSPEGAKFKWLS
jgi:hypothetical protein